MEVKRRAARSLVKRLTAADPTQIEESISELRLLTKQDPDSRVLLAEAGATHILVHHLLHSSAVDKSHQVSVTSQENATAALLNLSIYSCEHLMSTPGLLDALSQTLRFPSTPASAQHAAATVYSLLSVDAYRPIIGAKSDIVSALVRLLKAPGSPTRSFKDALKALFGISLYPLNRAAVIEHGAVPALFSLLFKDGRTGLVEDATAVIAQVAGCYESVDAFRKVSGTRVLVDLVDAETGCSARVRENAASALLNMAMSGGEKALGDIREIERAVVVIRELSEMGSPRAQSKAGSLLKVLVGRDQHEQWLCTSDPSSLSSAEDN